jgi:hypothetical protein
MLVKGIWIGAGVSIALVLLFWTLLNRHVHAIAGPGPVSYDVYSLRIHATSFFGGLSIGFILVLVPIVAGIYSFLRYARHHFPS